MIETGRRGGKYPILGIVDEEYLSKRRAYIVIDQNPEEAARAVEDLEQRGWLVINDTEERPADEIDLRVHLPAMCAADDLVLPDTWWASRTALILVNIAAMLKIPFVDYAGQPIETVKASL